MGNNIAQGTDGNSFGVIKLYGKNGAFTDFSAGNTNSTNRGISLPDKSGTVALTSDLSDKVNCTYTSWGYSLTFTPRAGNSNCHALVCVGNGNLALLWCVAGAVHISNFAGNTGITATRNNDGSVTVNRSSAETITIWY